MENQTATEKIIDTVGLEGYDYLNVLIKNKLKTEDILLLDKQELFSDLSESLEMSRRFTQVLLTEVLREYANYQGIEFVGSVRKIVNGERQYFYQFSNPCHTKKRLLDIVGRAAKIESLFLLMKTDSKTILINECESENLVELFAILFKTHPEMKDAIKATIGYYEKSQGAKQ